MKNGKQLWTLFSSTFIISAFTVGGGVVIIPLLRRKFVEELKWIDEAEMMDMVAIAQSAPGVMAVNTSIMIGFRLAGVLGTLITVVATVLPPLLTLSIISMFYVAFRDNQIVRLVLTGMQAGVAAVMVDMVYTMAKSILLERKILTIVMMIIALVAAIVCKVNVLIIILACGVVGGVSAFFKKEKRKGPDETQ